MTSVRVAQRKCGDHPVTKMKHQIANLPYDVPGLRVGHAQHGHRSIVTNPGDYRL